ncbi:MAG: hypothetical protein NXI24_09675 [bacterium]|nr:hypothetical protein [bacterium]
MEFKSLKVEELEIVVTRNDLALRLEWLGSIHSADPGDYLDPYFDLLIDAAASDGVAIVCDFSKLEYMNSSSIPPLIHLLRECGEREIKAEFTYDASRKVQTASFRALDVIARKSSFTSVKGL